MPISKKPLVHYPLGLLDVGDSFFIPALVASDHINTVQAKARQLGIKIDHRMGIDTATGLYGVRIVRTG
jgi:hypothetical protein